ncbi:ABC transporter permease [Aquitalea sp. ASV11]|uniref:ABC transporter permease n=1 Tax=Aquitalea sp. ASV11 TaxID=2795103 RepID=UPI0018EB82C3|nr:ABC transporter permease [Aquitalea sp. ASV11]
MKYHDSYSWFSWRDLIINLVSKEIKLRYMGAILGVLWSLGNPLLVTVTYLVVFTYIFPNHSDRFALHLVTGVFHWMLISQILPQSCDWLLNNSSLIKKIRFPKIALAMSGMLAACCFWLAALIVYVSMFKALGGEFTLAMIWYPFIILCYIAFIAGIGLTLSVIQVTFRDLKHFVDVLLPLLFWLTPIVWSTSALPVGIIKYLELNPLLPYFRNFYYILHQGIPPTPNDILLITTMSAISLAQGLIIFRRANNIAELM